jgi:hypothetical protein
MSETERAKKEAELLGQGWEVSYGFHDGIAESMNDKFVVLPAPLSYKGATYIRRLQVDADGWITLPQGTVAKPAWVTGVYRIYVPLRDSWYVYCDNDDLPVHNWKHVQKVQLLEPRYRGSK